MAMLFKRLKTFLVIISILLLLAIALVFLSVALANGNSDRIRMTMRLTATARPPLIDHSTIVTSTTIISYPKPELSVDDKILRDLECPLQSWGEQYCSSYDDQGQSESQGCYSISSTDSLLGGLQPSYPMAICSTGDGKNVYQAGCRITFGVSYIIEREGKYKKIDSLSKLKAVFAPIDTEVEALSYAIAATGYSAFYEKTTSPDFEYFVEVLENTHVEIHDKEYIVRLYDYSICGCLQHETIAVDVAVNRTGNIREVYREVVYRDAFEICGD
jgi:hypothetical protein